MEAMTDDELVEEIERRKEALLLKKRRLDEISQISQKRLRLMKELADVNQEMEESNLPLSSSSESLPSASSSASSSSSSTSLADSTPKPKNSMLSYWAAKDNNTEVIDVDEKENNGYKKN
jgi:hypothetical protein